MIVDMRTYTAFPGKAGAWLALYEAEGLPIQRKYLGEPLGFFTTEIGEMNQIIHLWGYESLADREKKRGAMQADPAWQAYLKKSAATGNLMHQEDKILKSTSFSRL